MSYPHWGIYSWIFQARFWTGVRERFLLQENLRTTVKMQDFLQIWFYYAPLHITCSLRKVKTCLSDAESHPATILNSGVCLFGLVLEVFFFLFGWFLVGFFGWFVCLFL